MLSLILHTRTVYTSTQLMRATDIGHTASVNLLLDAGAKVNVKNKKVSNFWPSIWRPLDAHQPSAAHLAHPMVVIRKALPGHSPAAASHHRSHTTIHVRARRHWLSQRKARAKLGLFVRPWSMRALAETSVVLSGRSRVGRPLLRPRTTRARHSSEAPSDSMRGKNQNLARG